MMATAAAAPPRTTFEKEFFTNTNFSWRFIRESFQIGQYVAIDGVRDQFIEVVLFLATFPSPPFKANRLHRSYQREKTG
jgi:hypothetical protein